MKEKIDDAKKGAKMSHDLRVEISQIKTFFLWRPKDCHFHLPGKNNGICCTFYQLKPDNLFSALP